jgi:hypothetical protein
MPIPRLIVGGVLLTLGLLAILDLPGVHAHGAAISQAFIAILAASIGTQVLLGKRIPGFRRRTRGGVLH